jgi:hypothetical protein
VSGVEGRGESVPEVVYVWQWQQRPDYEWRDFLGMTAVNTVEQAKNRHPQRPGPYRMVDDSIPVRLVKRTIVNEVVE